MNDLFSSSFNRQAQPDLEAGGPGTEMRRGPHRDGATVNLDQFFSDVEALKDELRAIESLHSHLKEAHEESKTLHERASVRALRTRMDSDVSQAVRRAKLVKVRLEALDRANAAHRVQPGCGPGSSTDRTRTSVVSGLRKKLRDLMEEFQSLRNTIQGEYRETIERRYFTVTGEKPDEAMLDRLVSTGEGENFMRRALQEGGRGQILDVISEIQERRDAVKELEKSLVELHQVFMDMSVLVNAQGEQLDNIESHVERANSYVRGGTQQLETARKHQKSTRKWTCIGIVVLLVILLIILLPILLRNTNNGGNNNGTAQP
ncbi:hypothetical protein AMTRI_Chr06g177720 [Amborella trichopoda]|uniref:t-SNARE coiled-coil homology domain-containing protein n=1 Tax=Amborella trichopoda TaxID=13333 RepID=W1PZ02_AMBTC|nr:syntaxin-125 [Amborella trichopoda]ERN13593.1 hypothetical protein AMTR_s00049p00050990 [Amborella trichopoda]|eukprot:XP_006852126.1 syntaxin-125 [Amborella trichopoda]